MNQPVAITVLCGAERHQWVNPFLMMRIIECIQDGQQSRRPVAVGVKWGVTPVDKARNQIVQEFLQSPCSWLIQIDNDVLPPPNFLRVIEQAEKEGKLVVGFPYPMNGNGGITWNIARRHDGKGESEYLLSLPNGWMDVPLIGAGLIAVHRAVLEKIGSDWFNSSATMSEDFAFSERARKAGFSVWTNGDFPCDHIHSISYLEVIRKLQTQENHGAQKAR